LLPEIQMRKRAFFSIQLLAILSSLTCCSNLVFAAEATQDKTQILASKQSSSQAAGELADEIIAAYGGEKVLRQVSEAGSRSKGKLVEYSTLSGAVNSFDCEILSKGEKMRIELNVMGQRLITGYDGKHGWVQQGDQVFEANETTEKRITEEIEHGLLLLLKLKDPGTKLEIVGAKLVGNRPCSILQAISTDGKPTLFFVDKSDHLVRQSQYQGFDTEQGTEATKVFQYDDYRPLDGSFVPYKVTEYSGQTKASETILVTSEDADLPDKIFQLPEIAESAIGKDEVVAIPFDYISNEVIVKAKVNDKDELNFVIDTGATQSVLDKSVAKTLGKCEDSNLTMTTGSGSVNLSYMNIPKMAIGDLTLKDIHFAVADLAAFSQILGQRPSGLIGANILRRFRVTIDYPQKKLILAHPSNVKVAPDAIAIPTKPALGMSGVLVDGELDGQKLSFLVDTGAAFNNISSKLAKPILSGSVLPVGSLEGLDGKKVKIGSVRFNTLKLGSITLKQPLFSVAPSDTNPAGIISGGALAILGNPLWRKYCVTIDYKNQRLILDRFQVAKDNEDALAQLHALEIRHLDKPSVNVVGDYKKLLQQIQGKNLPAAEAICLADMGLASGDAAEQPNSDTTTLKITNIFKDAQLKASECQDGAVESQVLAKWATYCLLHTPMAKSEPLARPLLAQAIKSCPTESSAYAATGLLLYRMHNPELAEQLVDQALMLDPANWQALWLKYDLANYNGRTPLKALVLEQLRRYYGDTQRVAALTSSAHPPIRQRPHTRRS
jgi:hypothetical protein